MIKYWYILILICKTVFIQALKHWHLVRIITGFQALCTVRYDTGATITYVYVTARQTNLTTFSDILDVVFTPKSFVLLSIFGELAKLREVTSSSVVFFCPSIHPHGTNRLPLEGFLLNLIF
jgi:hypothetical protein